MPAKRRGRKYAAKHMGNFISNMAEVDRLLEIPEETAGTTAGRKYRVAVLNKSSIVLLVACWEACVEDLAQAAFDILIKNAKDHTVFPGVVRSKASADLRKDQDASRVWDLAGNGWRDVIKQHREQVIQQYVGKLNTPRPEQIDRMFESLIGMKRLSGSWAWASSPAQRTTKKLDDLVTLRGTIAHRVSTAKSVHKSTVKQHREFVERLAVITHNAVNKYLDTRLEFRPWHDYEYG